MSRTRSDVLSQEDMLISNISEIVELEREITSKTGSDIPYTTSEHIDLSGSLSPEQKYLLVLSKIITGNDTCTGIYKDSNNFFYVANNNRDSSNFIAVKEILTKFSDNQEYASATKAFSSIQKTIYSSRTSARDRAKPKPSENTSDKFNEDITFLLERFEPFGRNFIQSSDFIRSKAEHAEMQLLPIVVEDEANKNPAIITSKLVCSPCHNTVNLLQELIGKEIKTVGMH